MLRAIRGTTVSIMVDRDELGDVTARLTELTGRPIVFSDGAAAHMDTVVSRLDLQDVSLATALFVLQSTCEEPLVWDVSGESVVFHLERDHPGRMQVQVFALVPLYSGLTSVTIPPSRLQAETDDVADEDNPLFGGDGDGEPMVSPADAEELLRRIRAEVGPSGTWDPPAKLALQGSMTLVATNYQAVLEKLGAYIEAWIEARDDE